MRLDTEFRKLPIRFDAERLAWEVSQFVESEWRSHPQGHAGNSALALIAAHGDPDDDAARGPMRPTPHLRRCPYIRQVLAALGSVLGRTRLMRIVGQGEATAHVDTNYYWLQRVRVHVPVITSPEVQFVCGDRSVHMAAGETWIFDTWRLHNVLNPADRARIHLVADTVGSSAFWELVARGEAPAGDGHSPRPMSAAGPAPVPYVLGHEPELETERINVPVVMSPWEQQCLIVPILGDLAQADPAASGASADLEALLERFHRDWRSAWSAHGDGASGWLSFRRLLQRFDGQLASFEGRLRLPNDLDAVEALRQAVVRPALDPERTAELPMSPRDPQPPTPVDPEPRQFAIGVDTGKAPAPGYPAAPWPRTADRFDRPVFIVSAPRAGSTMLFEALARAPGFWTVGGESHEVFESLPTLRPAGRGFDSNRLTAADADPATAEALRGRFLGLLRDAEGRSLPSDAPTVRMLEKTPKNALRIPFLDAVFPDALFIYLYREPHENLSSIMEAWRSGRFVTYPDLPGWEGPPWSLLLIPGWRELSGRPVAEVAAAQWAAAQSAILDDLARLAPGRWCTVTYDALVADPAGQIERLCAFAGVPSVPGPTGPLPWSRYTLTPPSPGKWRNNADALEAVIPRVAGVAARARRAVADDPSRPGDAPCTTSPVAPPAPRPRAPEPAPVAADDDGAGALRSVHSANFPGLLDELGVSLLVTTYQAGKLIVVRSEGDRLNTHFRDFPMPMGLAYSGNRLALGTSHHVWEFRDQPEVARKREPAGRYDACFLPRACHVTGDIRIHEIAWAGDELWIVNTQFSCLCTLDRAYSFVPRWRPPFVSGVAPEDRCHLNGLAVADGRPRYVTAFGRTDTAAGWRADKARGGCLLDVPSGEIVVAGLSMPHSPRWHNGKLWVLGSGEGTLAVADPERGLVETVATLPGFTRGLDFVGPYAFVGLSQVRETASFSGLPITERLQERTCGVWVIDLRSGQAIAFLRFEAGVQEIFAVQVLPCVRFPEVVDDDDPAIGSSFVLPDEALADVPRPRDVPRASQHGRNGMAVRKSRINAR